jgi:anti-repressor protein
MANSQALTVFEFSGAKVRTVSKDGEPWFVAKDVCDALGISNGRDAVSVINEAMKDAVGISDAMSRTQKMTVLSEAGVYKLVFRSRRPEADKFTDWIAAEVLPQIRKTGAFGVPQAAQDWIALDDNDKAIAYFTKCKEVSELEPKAEAFDTLCDSGQAVTMAEAAKLLKLPFGRNTLFRKLREMKILDRKNVAYQPHVTAGHFRLIETIETDHFGATRVFRQTLVEQKGLNYLRKKFLTKDSRALQPLEEMGNED